jgi:hypothetical protein
MVAFPPGGSTDIGARVVAGIAEKMIGQPIVVVNKGGAGGQVGWTDLVRQKPDGYNIGVNDGRAAGQTVMHLHVHLIPRFNGDRGDPRGGVRWVIPEKAQYWQEDVAICY